MAKLNFNNRGEDTSESAQGTVKRRRLDDIESRHRIESLAVLLVKLRRTSVDITSDIQELRRFDSFCDTIEEISHLHEPIECPLMTTSKFASPTNINTDLTAS